jgi:CRP/FNR family transcriptional regulator
MNDLAASSSPSPDAFHSAAAARAAQLPDSDEVLDLLAGHLQVSRRLVREGDVLQRSGERFTHLAILRSGMAKLVTLAPDGREQVVGLKFKGDWIGLDGIGNGHHGCDAVAMDTGEVWSVRYDALVTASVRCPALLARLHAAMSDELRRERETLMSLNTLRADARVAHFLRNWAGALQQRGLRTDQIRLRMSRAEIGNFLGLTLESVSRAMSRLAREQVIRFAEGGRRDIEIPRLQALDDFDDSSLAAVQ